MIFKKIRKALNNYGIDNVTALLIVIVMVMITICVSINMKSTPFAAYPNKTSSQHISMSLMKQSLNSVTTDRINNHLSRLPITPATQSIAQSECNKAYNTIPGKIRKTYQMQTLYTNDDREETPITKELIKASKNVKGISYHSNITTVSFGNRHYTQTQRQWHPWYRVTTPYRMSEMINKRMIQKTHHNIHRHNILNKNNQSIGVFAKYNKKLNRGVLVETFREKE